MAKNWIQQILGEAEIFAQNERVMYPHYVFTGGGTSLDGFLEFLKKNFSRDAKIGFSHKVEANYELLVDSSMAAALGAYKSIALSKRFEDKMTAGPSGTLQKTLSTAKNWFSNYF